MGSGCKSGTCPRIVVLRGSTSGDFGVSLLEKSASKGESPFWHCISPRTVFLQRVTFLGTGAQMGGKCHPKKMLRKKSLFSYGKSLLILMGKANFPRGYT